MCRVLHSGAWHHQTTRRHLIKGCKLCNHRCDKLSSHAQINTISLENIISLTVNPCSPLRNLSIFRWNLLCSSSPWRIRQPLFIYFFLNTVNCWVQASPTVIKPKQTRTPLSNTSRHVTEDHDLSVAIRVYVINTNVNVTEIRHKHFISGLAQLPHTLTLNHIN